MNFYYSNNVINQLKHQDAKLTPEQLERYTERFLNVCKPFLGNHMNILDIGAGIGLIDVLIFKRYNGKFYCLDRKDKSNDGKTFGWHSNVDTFITRADTSAITKEFMSDNGVDLNKIAFLDYSEVQKGIHLNVKFDVVLSIRSCGWHYPIEVYKNWLLNHSDNHTMFIMDIRKNQNGPNGNVLEVGPKGKTVAFNYEQLLNYNEKK